MTDRPHVVIPGDVTSSFATSEGLTGDAAHLAALMSTARSRLVIATTSPDASQCRQALIWMQPGPCVVARTVTTPDGDTELPPVSWTSKLKSREWEAFRVCGSGVEAWSFASGAGC